MVDARGMLGPNRRSVSIVYHSGGVASIFVILNSYAIAKRLNRFRIRRQPDPFPKLAPSGCAQNITGI